MKGKRRARAEAERGFTLFEVVLSIVLAGILLGTLIRSVASFVEVHRRFHLITQLSRQGWISAERIRREIRGGVPGSLTVDPGGGGLSLDRIQCEGVAATTNAAQNYLSDPFLKTGEITADARLIVLRKGTAAPVETRITGIHAGYKRIYYEDNMPGEPDFQPGDRYWTTRERVGFSMKGDQLLRSLSICLDGSGACTLDRQWPLTDRVSAFQVSWNGPGHPLELEQQLAEGGTEIGGNYRILPSSP